MSADRGTMLSPRLQAWQKFHWLPQGLGRFPTRTPFSQGLNFTRLARAERKAARQWTSSRCLSEACASLRTRWNLPYLSILMDLELSYTWRVIFFIPKSILIKYFSNFQCFSEFEKLFKSLVISKLLYIKILSYNNYMQVKFETQ